MSGILTGDLFVVDLSATTTTPPSRGLRGEHILELGGGCSDSCTYWQGCCQSGCARLERLPLVELGVLELARSPLA